MNIGDKSIRMSGLGIVFNSSRIILVPEAGLGSAAGRQRYECPSTSECKMSSASIQGSQADVKRS